MHCNDDSPLAVRVRCLRKWEAMAERGWSVLFWYQLCAVFCGIYGVLDLEELKSVNYGIDIENTPIMFKEVNTAPMVMACDTNTDGHLHHRRRQWQYHDTNYL